MSLQIPAWLSRLANKLCRVKRADGSVSRGSEPASLRGHRGHIAPGPRALLGWSSALAQRMSRGHQERRGHCAVISHPCCWRKVLARPNLRHDPWQLAGSLHLMGFTAGLETLKESSELSRSENTASYSTQWSQLPQLETSQEPDVITHTLPKKKSCCGGFNDPKQSEF